MGNLITTFGIQDLAAVGVTIIAPFILIWFFIYFPIHFDDVEQFTRPRTMLSFYFMLAFIFSGIATTFEYFSARIDGYSPSFELLFSTLDFSIAKLAAGFIAGIPFFFGASVALSRINSLFREYDKNLGWGHLPILVLIFAFITAPCTVISFLLFSTPWLWNLLFGQPMLLSEINSLDRSVYLSPDYPLKLSVVVERISQALSIPGATVTLITILAALATIGGFLLQLVKHYRKNNEETFKKEDNLNYVPPIKPKKPTPVISDITSIPKSYDYRSGNQDEFNADKVPPLKNSDEENDYHDPVV